MATISSINFKKSIIINTEHNDRLKPPSYIISDNDKDYEFNLNSYEAKLLKNQIIENAKEAYTKHTGQKFQAKSYEWSAVVNLKPESTMQDLEKLSEHFLKKYGFQCYQIAIHRDEGHINEQGEKVINHHAHLEFITLDRETGKNNYNRQKISPSVLRQMQTEVAEILQMERGQDKKISKRKRVEPRLYGAMKEQEKKLIIQKNNKIQELENQIENDFLSVKEIKDFLENFRKESIGKGLPKEFFRDLSEAKKTTKEATLQGLKNFCNNLLENYQSKINALESDLKAEKEKNDKLLEKNNKNDLRGNFDDLNDKDKKIKELENYIQKMTNFFAPIMQKRIESQSNNLKNADKKQENAYITRFKELSETLKKYFDFGFDKRKDHKADLIKNAENILENQNFTKSNHLSR